MTAISKPTTEEQVAGKQTKRKGAQIGIPLPVYEAAVDTLQQLQVDGKFQLFLARENAIRFVGETDEFRVALGKRLGSEAVDKRKVYEYLDEVQVFFQISLVTERSPSAAKIFETHVYDDEFEQAKGDPNHSRELREIIQRKLEVVSSKLVSDAILQRAKRLGTVIGPLLEDLDIEVISQRKSPNRSKEIDAPFLRLRLRYSNGGQISFPALAPPWVTNPPQDVRSFDLECDEADIDLLISRLLQAKELLANAVGVKVRPENSDSSESKL